MRPVVMRRRLRMLAMATAFAIAVIAIAMAVAGFFTTGRWRMYGGEHRAYFAMSGGGSLRVWSQELWIMPATPRGYGINVGKPDTVNIVAPGGVEYPTHMQFFDLPLDHQFMGV